MGKIPNTFKQTPPKEPPSLFSTVAGGYTVSGRGRIRFQVFPSCVIVCDMRKKTKERQVSLRCVLEAGRGRRNLVAGHKRYPAARNIHLLFPASPSLTCGRKRLLRRRAREETQEAGVDVAAPPRFGVKSNPQSQIGDPCFWEEPPLIPLPPLFGPVSSPLKERRTRGADCCRPQPRQTHRANRRSRTRDAVMATVMQVAHRDLNLDGKKA